MKSVDDSAGELVVLTSALALPNIRQPINKKTLTIYAVAVDVTKVSQSPRQNELLL